MSCEFEHLDGSYVLGALSPAERRDFESHLAGCDECSRSVRELAGMPGLLALADASVLEPPPDVVPVPDTLLPALLSSVRRTSRPYAAPGGVVSPSPRSSPRPWRPSRSSYPCGWGDSSVTSARSPRRRPSRRRARLPAYR
jgi:anti-sigma factor RsiW